MSNSGFGFGEMGFPLTSWYFFIVTASEGNLNVAKGFACSTAGQEFYRICTAIRSIGVERSLREFCEDIFGDRKCGRAIGIINSNQVINSSLDFIEQAADGVE